MPLVVPTADYLKGVALQAFQSHFPGVRVEECLPPDSLYKHCELKPMGAPVTVVSAGDLMEADAKSMGANDLVEFELVRETCSGSEVQVRGIVRLRVNRHRDGQEPKARRAFQFLAQQIREIGPVEWVLVEREGVESGPSDVLTLSLLARIKAFSEDQITIDERGIFRLSDTRSKVGEIVAWSLDKKWSVWQIYQQYGGSIPLRAIHAAFTGFDNYREKILKELDDEDQYVAEMRAKMGQPPAIQRLLSNRK
jgi:hypothetical protein